MIGEIDVTIHDRTTACSNFLWRVREALYMFTEVQNYYGISGELNLAYGLPWMGWIVVIRGLSRNLENTFHNPLSTAYGHCDEVPTLRHPTKVQFLKVTYNFTTFIFHPLAHNRWLPVPAE